MLTTAIHSYRALPNLVPFSHLPFWVAVLLQHTLVGARQHYQAAILAGCFLHCCPGTHNAISWPEREVVQVLVHGVARGLLSWATVCTAIHYCSEIIYWSKEIDVHVSRCVCYLYQGVC